MKRFIFFALFPWCALSVWAAANLPPTIGTQLADQTIYQNAVATISLDKAFADPDTKAVRLTTSLGTFDIELFSQAKPITVINFLKYVDEGHYFMTDPTTHHRASSFIHRSASNFVIQGGGFIGTVSPTDPAKAQPTAVATFPPIQNEPGISNTRGTIAMAKLGNDPNSATSQWFINLADNSANLDAQNGGFTVFGRVVGNGMTFVDHIAEVPVYNLTPTNPNSAFTTTPLINYNGTDSVKVENFVSIPSFTQTPPFTFSATSSDPSVATVALSSTGKQLRLTGKQPGTATITVTARDYDGATVSQSFGVETLTAPGRFTNIATRLQVGVDPNALIAGFRLSGSASKRLLIRAIGPSLASNSIANPLADPILELHDKTKLLARSNDYNDSTNRQAIIDTGIPPSSDKEAALLVTLPANNASYTAIVRGVGQTSGVGLVEVYDLDYAPGSTIANVSTRGLVDTGDNVLIGGFILGGSSATNVMVRGIGPSLATAGISNPLMNPTLELHNDQGTIIAGNNDWTASSNASDIQQSGIAPTDSRESAILGSLAAGRYTAIVKGVGGTTGVGVVEVYQLP